MKSAVMVAALALFVILTAGLTGCASGQAQETVNVAQAVVLPLVDEPDPAMALSKIYEDITIPEVQYAADSDLLDRFLLDPALLDDYEVNFTNGRYGIANVFILKPAQGENTKVRDALERIKLNIIKECERYDIYNASEIAQSAPIFEQNGYLIMLMVEDLNTARTIIDQYIPKT